jgi:hypothetical protein
VFEVLLFAITFDDLILLEVNPDTTSISVTVALLNKIWLLTAFISNNPPKLSSECFGTITKLEIYGDA